MIVEGNSPAECWLKILQKILSRSGREISPLEVRINNVSIVPPYQKELEEDINNFLSKIRQPSIEKTAGTIFPQSLIGGKQSVYQRYEKIWSHIQKDHKNKRGTYFQRMTSWGRMSGDNINQLQLIVDTYKGVDGVRKGVHRRSALIATIFDPRIDHTHQPMLGFPCLQQVCIVPHDDEVMEMNAIYAMQYLSTRAYGNYAGLMRLGEFMAREMGLKFTHLNCMISTISLGDKMNKSEAEVLLKKYVQYVK
ncbi:hypothetical protein [Zhongshania borealis]|uniref:Thymidylate synthase n=1 Tax=Zhongshania borealis TaxID=889488 RepID=A0ABP7WQY8_9GAMM